MNNRAHAIRTGLFVIVFVTAIFAAAFWIGGDHRHRVPYIVQTTGSVFGLRTQSTVFFRGLNAGIVKRITVDPRDPRKIAIRIAIDKNIPVTRGTYAQLKLQGVTGLSVLELNTTADMRPLPTSSQHPAHIPMRPSLLAQLTHAGTDAIQQLGHLSHDLRQILGRANRRHMSAILAHAAQASRQWQSLTGRLNAAAGQLPGMEDEIDQSLTQLTRVTRQVNALSARLNRLGATAQGASTFVLTRTLPRMNKALARLAAAAADVQRLSRSLRHHPRELLLGARPLPPGPGEQGYKEGSGP